MADASGLPLTLAAGEAAADAEPDAAGFVLAATLDAAEEAGDAATEAAADGLTAAAAELAGAALLGELTAAVPPHAASARAPRLDAPSRSSRRREIEDVVIECLPPKDFKD